MSLVENLGVSLDEAALDTATKKDLLQIANQFGIVVRKNKKVDQIRAEVRRALREHSVNGEGTRNPSNMAEGGRKNLDQVASAGQGEQNSGRVTTRDEEKRNQEELEIRKLELSIALEQRKLEVKDREVRLRELELEAGRRDNSNSSSNFPLNLE